MEPLHLPNSCWFFLNTWPWSLTLAPTPVRRNTSQNAIWLPVRCSLHEKMVTFRVEMSAGISTAGQDAGRSISFIPAVPAAWSVTTIAFI